MPIESTPIYGNVEKNHVPLVVTESGLTITVQPGDFVIAGESHSLPEEQVFAATADSAHQTLITGYLARETATGAAMLLVDTMLLDESQVQFSFGGSGFELLHRLFVTTLDINAAEFGNVRVYNIIPREHTAGSARTRGES